MDKIEDMRYWLEKHRAAGGFIDDKERKAVAAAMVRAAMGALEEDYKSGNLVQFFYSNRELIKLLPSRAGTIADRCATLACAIMFFAQFADVVAAEGKPEPVDPVRN